MSHVKVKRESLKKANETNKPLVLKFRYRKELTSVSTIELPKSEGFRLKSTLCYLDNVTVIRKGDG